MNYRENEDTSASKCKLLTHLPQNANYIHPSQTCLFRKMSACPSLGRPGKRQLLKQHEQIWNLKLLYLKSFTSTEYLWYGHWKAWNLFSASPSTDISVKDNRLRMIFILETKIDPRRKNNKGILCMSQKRFPERGEKGDWAVTERFQLPVIYREAQKRKQSPNLKGLVGIFPHLEMDWRWTDYDICKKGIPALRQKRISSGQTVFIYHRGQVSRLPTAGSHCDRNDSIMANLWTESDTEIWEASSRQWLNL